MKYLSLCWFHSIKSTFHITSTFKRLVETLQFIEHCLESDVFLYMACGMMVSNPEEGLRVMDELVSQGRVVSYVTPHQITLSKQLLQSIDHVLQEKGMKLPQHFEEKYKSFM